MGVVSKFIDAVNAVSGVPALGGTVYVDRADDNASLPHTVLGDITADPLIDTADFESGEQPEWYNVTLKVWTTRLVDAESWAALVEAGINWTAVTVPGYMVLGESVERGRKRFGREKPRGTQAQYVHFCELPYRFAVERVS